MKICVVVNGYPTPEDPSYAFIQPLVWGLADEGVQCTVIAPQSISSRIAKRKSKRVYRWIDKTKKGNEIIIFQPEYISLSNFRIYERNLSITFRDVAIEACFRKEGMKPDALYAHFWDCGIAACKLAEKNKIPVFVATGESTIRVYDYYSKKTIGKYLTYVTGVIAVSNKNLEESREKGLLANKPRTTILPNAVNPEEFFFVPREVAREKIGVEDTTNVAIFVGAFSERKGVLRVVEAAKNIENLKLILIGSGELQPSSDKILFSGRVAHNMVVYYLNAADMFVLPTLAEGCCNAIVEALACGLPVISSRLAFNMDILNENNSILVDPTNIKEIEKAMVSLLSDKNKFRSLSEGAQKSSETLLIGNRCKAILSFLLSTKGGKSINCERN